MAKPRLTNEAVDWAYEKWLDGYTVFEIAKALDCSDSALHDRFARAGFTKEKPPLRVPKDMIVRE